MSGSKYRADNCGKTERYASQLRYIRRIGETSNFEDYRQQPATYREQNQSYGDSRGATIQPN